MLSLFGILTAIFFVGTLKINRALQVLFASLSTLFFLLAIGLSFPIVTKIAGWFGLYVAGVAFYTAARFCPWARSPSRRPPASSTPRARRRREEWEADFDCPPSRRGAVAA